MTVSNKLSAYISAAICACMAVNALVVIKLEERMLESEKFEDTEEMGKTLGNVLNQIWNTENIEQILEDADNSFSDRPGKTVRWRWLATQEKSRESRNNSEFATRLRKNADGEEIVLVRLPMEMKDGSTGVLEISSPGGVIQHHQRYSLIKNSITTVILLIVNVILVGLAGVYLIREPLKKLVDKTRRVNDEDYSTPVVLSGNDEFTTLGEALNTMCISIETSNERIKKETDDKIAALEQLRHADRLKTIGQLSSGIAHELGTPLNVISGRATQIRNETISQEETLKNAEIIKTQTIRMTSLIRQLLDFSRRGEPKVQMTNVATGVDNSVELMTPLAKSKNIEITVALESTELWGMLDEIQVEQVFMILLVNAIQACSENDHVNITGRFSTNMSNRTPQEGILIEISDDGIGISDKDLKEIFDPFFTKKGAGEGTGLGLSIAREIVVDHGGSIKVSSELHKGSSFSVWFPSGETS